MSVPFPREMPDRTGVKICGLGEVEHVDVAVECSADAVGIVRHPDSPRHVGLRQAAALAEAARGRVSVVAVTVLPTDADMTELVGDVGVDAVQIHGPVEEAAFLRWRDMYPATILLRAVRVLPGEVWPQLDPAGAHAILVDAHVEGSMGGTGVRVRWQRARSSVPLVLAGGLTASNVSEAIRAVRPTAVDVSSGVEIAPGVKDAKLIEEFVRAVRATRNVGSGA